MRALITFRQTKDSHGADIESLESDYVRFYESLGVQLIPVPNFTLNPRLYFELNPDFIILTGGGSIPGEYYNPAKEGVDSPERDFVERELFEEALSKNMPILVICRGMQYVNALLGGRLSVLDLKVKRPIAVDHKIQLNGEEMLVNNYHNDGIYIKDLSEKLKPIGVDVDNEVVEVYENKEMKILGIQSHPERKMSDDASKAKLTSLIMSLIKDL